MAKEEKQVNEAQFLKSLNKKAAAAKAAAKAERPSGIMTDAMIMKKLGLEDEGDSITLAARVSKIQFGYAKKDTDRPYFRFAYALSENSPNTDEGKGMIVSNYHELTEAEKDGEVWRSEEQAFEQLFFEFQAIGESTKDWKDPVQEALKAAKRHTAEKTEIQVMLSVYAKRDGSVGLNIRPDTVAPADNSDLEDEEEGDDEGDLNDFVGGWVTWTDDEGSVDFKVTAYNEEEETFTGVDEDDDEYEAPVAECEWSEDQRDD